MHHLKEYILENLLLIRGNLFLYYYICLGNFERHEKDIDVYSIDIDSDDLLIGTDRDVERQASGSWDGTCAGIPS